MTTPSFVAFFFSRPEPESKKADSPHPKTLKHQGLYDKIVNRLLEIHNDRYFHENPRLVSPSFRERQACALIFRQSKSWKTIEEIFNKILKKEDHKEPETPIEEDAKISLAKLFSQSTDNELDTSSTKSSTEEKINTWASSWIQRIAFMRELEKEAQKIIQKIAEYNERKDPAQNEFLIDLEETRSKIEDHLKEGKANIEWLVSADSNETEEKAIKEDSLCQSVIDIINTHWPQLNVFLELPEVSLDDESVAAQIRHLKSHKDDFSRFNQLSDPSTKCIYIIEELALQVSPLPRLEENESIDPGMMIRPTCLGIKSTYPSDTSPKPRRKSSATSEDTPGSPTQDSQQSKDISLLEIDQIVRSALDEVNKRLGAAKTPTTSPNPMYRGLWLQVFG